MYDWRHRTQGPMSGGPQGPSREALYTALQRSQQEHHHLREQAAREVDRLSEENARLRRAAQASAATAERLRTLEGELASLRAAQRESERLYADNARLRAELEAVRQAPPPAPALALASVAPREDDRVLRLVADLANLRRRQGEELERARRSARAELVREFVASVDALEQALYRLADPESPWHQGIAAVQRQLLATLRGAGVEPLGMVGEPFSPHLHEAIGAAPHDSLAPDHIATVVRSGYRFAGVEGPEALIRPARVILSA